MSDSIHTIIFPEIDGGNWMGGVTYFNNLRDGLTRINSEFKIQLVKVPSFKTTDLVKRVRNKILKSVSKNDHRLLKIFNAEANGNKYMVFSNNAEYLKLPANVPKIFWIPDFQHLYLENYFSKGEVRARNRMFKEGADLAGTVVLSSLDAKSDFEKFSPENAYKAKVLSFVSNMPDDIYSKSTSEVVKKYFLPQEFFYVPNQFWEHKNHIVIFEALRLLQKRNIRPFVVFTGTTFDSKNVNYFSKLLEKISAYNLREQTAILGFIERDDLYQLIRQCVAVVNPSLFEGWSTSVEETKSIGKKMILSDIGVHREQDPPKSLYFDPDSSEDLANKLETFWNSTKGGPDVEMESEARTSYEIRINAYSQALNSVFSGTSHSG